MDSTGQISHVQIVSACQRNPRCDSSNATQQPPQKRRERKKVTLFICHSFRRSFKKLDCTVPIDKTPLINLYHLEYHAAVALANDMNSMHFDEGWTLGQPRHGSAFTSSSFSADKAMQVVCEHPTLWLIGQLPSGPRIVSICCVLQWSDSGNFLSRHSCQVSHNWLNGPRWLQHGAQSWKFKQKPHCPNKQECVCLVCIQQYVGAPCGCRLELAALAARSRPRPLECRFCLRDRSHTR